MFFCQMQLTIAAAQSKISISHSFGQFDHQKEKRRRAMPNAISLNNSKTLKHNTDAKA